MSHHPLVASTIGDGCWTAHSHVLGFERHPQPCNCMSMNHVPECPVTNFDATYDHIDGSDSLFHHDDLPMPDFFPAFDTVDTDHSVSLSSEPPNLDGSSSSPISNSEDSNAPQMTPPSPEPLEDTITLSRTRHPDPECRGYLAIPRAPTLKCSACARVFGSTSHLERHSEDHARFTCTKGCKKTFTSKKDRRRHEKDVHEKQKLRCKVCGRVSRRDNMKRHMKTHDSDRSERRP